MGHCMPWAGSDRVKKARNASSDCIGERAMGKYVDSIA